MLISYLQSDLNMLYLNERSARKNTLRLRC